MINKCFMPVDSSPEQASFIEWLLEQQGKEGRWTILYLASDEVNQGVKTTIFSWLIPLDATEMVVDYPEWDVLIGDGIPGFPHVDVSKDLSKVRLLDERNGLEPLVKVRDFGGLNEAAYDIPQDLVLMFNLWQDPADGKNFYRISPIGKREKVIEASGEGVFILTSLLLRYIAAKQKALVLGVDRVIIKSEETECEMSVNEEDDRFTLRLEVFNDRLVVGNNKKSFSRLLGKKVILPFGVEKSGIGPFEARGEYQNFIIGEGPVGENIYYSCDPDGLADNFGSNPDKPKYLTPVYFDPKVLNRYIDSQYCEVEDGYIRAGHQWGVSIDNHSPGPVGVFLGDIGRDLPASERDYWKGYNLPPGDQCMSETEIARAFRAQEHDTTSPEMIFKEKYKLLNEAWAGHYGWPLFLPLYKNDEYALKGLRIPEDNTWDFFDRQVINLTKLVVDSLNEKEINLQLTIRKSDVRGIKKFESFLNQERLADVTAVITYLQKVQAIRSEGAAHKKGSRFNLVRHGLTEKDLVESFQLLLSEGSDALEVLINFCGNGGALKNLGG